MLEMLIRILNIFIFVSFRACNIFTSSVQFTSFRFVKNLEKYQNEIYEVLRQNIWNLTVRNIWIFAPKLLNSKGRLKLQQLRAKRAKIIFTKSIYFLIFGGIRVRSSLCAIYLFFWQYFNNFDILYGLYFNMILTFIDTEQNSFFLSIFPDC